jgi:hypothetical protein
MQTQLTQANPDYKGLLYLTNSKVMPIHGKKNSISHEFEDGRVSEINLSTSNFDIELQFEYISDFDRSLINILFHDEQKANGGENTFLWQHPKENMAYVARFITPLRNVYKPGNLQSIDTIKIRISAYYGQALSTYTDMRLYVEDGYCEFFSISS